MLVFKYPRWCVGRCFDYVLVLARRLLLQGGMDSDLRRNNHHHPVEESSCLAPEVERPPIPWGSYGLSAMGGVCLSAAVFAFLWSHTHQGFADRGASPSVVLVPNESEMVSPSVVELPEPVESLKVDNKPVVELVGAIRNAPIVGSEALYMVVDTEPTVKVGKGVKPRIVSSEGGVVTVAKPVRLEEVPEEVFAQTYALYSRDALACKSKPRDQVWLAGTLLDMYDEWDAESAWAAIEEHAFLAVELDVGSDACKKALWARDARLPVGNFTANLQVAEREKLKSRAEEEFFKTPVSREIQHTYTVATGDKNRWYDRQWGSGLGVWRIENGGQTYWYANAQAGGCGEHEAALSSLFLEDAETGAFSLLWSSTDWGLAVATPTSAVTSADKGLELKLAGGDLLHIQLDVPANRQTGPVNVHSRLTSPIMFCQC